MIYFIMQGQNEKAFKIFTLNFAGNENFSNALVKIFRLVLLQYFKSLRKKNPTLVEFLQNFGSFAQLQQTIESQNQYAEGVILLIVAMYLKMYIQIGQIENGNYRVSTQYGNQYPNKCSLLLHNHHYLLLYTQEQYKQYMEQDSWRLLELQLFNLIKNRKVSLSLFPPDPEKGVGLLSAQNSQASLVEELRVRRQTQPKKKSQSYIQAQSEPQSVVQQQKKQKSSVLQFTQKQQSLIEEAKRYIRKAKWRIQFVQFKDYQELKNLYNKQRKLLQQNAERVRVIEIQKTQLTQINQMVISIKEVHKQKTNCKHKLNLIRIQNDQALLSQEKLYCPQCLEQQLQSKEESFKEKELMKQDEQQKEKVPYSKFLSSKEKSFVKSQKEQKRKIQNVASTTSTKLQQFSAFLCRREQSEKQKAQQKLKLKRAKTLKFCDICKKDIDRSEGIKSRCQKHKFHLRCLTKKAETCNVYQTDCCHCPECSDREEAVRMCKLCGKIGGDEFKCKQCNHCGNFYCRGCLRKHEKRAKKESK